MVMVMDNNGGAENPDWIVGRIYADWCVHCINMKKDWQALKSDMAKEKVGKVKFMDIEEKEMPDKLQSLNGTYFGGKDAVQSSGFPTIFMFRAKTKSPVLDYYKGERNLESMKQWITSSMGSSHKGGGGSFKIVKKAKRGSCKNVRKGGSGCYKKKGGKTRRNRK